jgi:hypothetical protein
MTRLTVLALLASLAACAQPQNAALVNGGDELSPFVGEPIDRASDGITRTGYRVVRDDEDGAAYWLNARSGACARLRFGSGRLLSVVQLPRTAC